MSTIASKFAWSLDLEDYESVRSCLAADCVYDSPSGELTGPAAIIESYQGIGDNARERFDAIAYSHQLTALRDGWYKINFSDELTFGERTHVFRCQQRVKIEQNLIVRIIHEEIPGQREAFSEFLESCGLA